MAAFQQLFCFVWEMVRNTVTAGAVGLVDVDALNRASNY